MFEVIWIVEAAALSFSPWNGWGGTKTLHSLERMSGCFCRIREMLRRATYCTSGAEEIIVTIISGGEWRGNCTQWRTHFLDERFLHVGTDVVEIQHDDFDCRHNNACILMLKLWDNTFTNMFCIFHIRSTIFRKSFQ